MQDYVAQLLDIVPAPEHPRESGTPEAWRNVESKLQVDFPEDFKEITTSYGTGRWQEFWFFLNPFTRNVYLNLCLQVTDDGALWAERYIRDEQDSEYPHPIHPEPGGIFPWAVTDNGGRFFWLTDGAPAQWKTVYYSSRDPDFSVYDVPCSRLLFDAVMGNIDIFAEEFGDGYRYGQPTAFEPLRLTERGSEPV